MDTRLREINRELKSYDRDLYADRIQSGMVQIYRKSVRWESFKYDNFTFHYAKKNPQFILALTDNWLLTGKPAEWGLEPLIQRMKEMDQWRDDGQYARLVKERERQEEDKERSKRNNIRAIASDLRKDFAKATNEINTSTLEKIDKRRFKNGNRR